MSDKYKLQYTDLNSPAVDAFLVTPSDSTVFVQPTRFLYIGRTGDVVVRFAKSQTDIFYQAVPAGTYLRIRVDKVYATGTTANAIVGEF